MIKDLEELFIRLEDQRAEVLNPLKGLDHSTLVWKPRPTRWNVMEILQHLITSEQLTLSYMKKKSNAIESLSDSGWIESVKLLGFKVSQRLPLRFKAPKMIVPITVPGSIVECEALWNESRAQIKSFLDQLKETHLKRKIYRHPLVGRFSCQQALEIMYEHIQHHRPQIRNLLRR